MPIAYNTTGNTERGHVTRYHGSPRPLDRRSGASVSDLAGLRQADRQSLKQASLLSIRSRYGIGFEVEKTSFNRSAVREYPLFAGFERDGSCGYEAITHILPLLPPCEWRNKVYSMFHEAERLIDDAWSPSDRRCGGHVTLSVDTMTGGELLEHIAPYCGIVLALYRLRLNNSYCNRNPNLKLDSSEAYNGIHSKYNVAKVMHHGIEFRVPSRVKSVADLKRRYELFYLLVDSARQSHEGNPPSVRSVNAKVRSIIKLMYRDEAKEERIMDLAKDFQRFIKTGKMTFSVLPFLDQYGYATSNWRTRDANRRMQEGETNSRW